jgi:hypothetical protein
VVEGARERQSVLERARWLVPVLVSVIVVQLCAAVAALHGLGQRDTPAARASAGGHTGGGSSSAGRPTTPDYSGGVDRDPAQAADRAGQVRALLARRGTALVGRNRRAFLGTLDPKAPAAFRAAQTRAYDNLAKVPLAQWRLSLDATLAAPVTATVFGRYQAPVWVPHVTLCYALAGYDDRCTERPEQYTFVRRGTAWYLGGDNDLRTPGASWQGLWDFGPVAVHRGAHSLLLAHTGNADRLGALAEQVDQAVPHVTGVWGRDWAQRVVVLVPDTQQEMASLLGQSAGLTDIAAVATADYADPLTGVVTGQRIVLNPANLDRLGGIGRTVVLRHEITHLAARAVTGPGLPTWLVEGFADYVGYLDTGVPVSVAAQELRADVQRGDYPKKLPGNDDFKFDNPKLPQAYESAWMACRVIASQAGTAALVRLYRTVGADHGDPGGALDRGLRRVLDISGAELVDRWRASVVTELS